MTGQSHCFRERCNPHRARQVGAIDLPARCQGRGPAILQKAPVHAGPPAPVEYHQVECMPSLVLNFRSLLPPSQGSLRGPLKCNPQAHSSRQQAGGLGSIRETMSPRAVPVSCIPGCFEASITWLLGQSGVIKDPKFLTPFTTCAHSQAHTHQDHLSSRGYAVEMVRSPLQRDHDAWVSAAGWKLSSIYRMQRSGHAALPTPSQEIFRP